MGILRQNSGDITQGVIWKQLLAFFFPLWFGTFFQQLYNTVDTVVVGRFVGKTALAAVGSTGVVVNLTVGVFTGLASGAVVIIAQHYGARRGPEVFRSVHTAMLLSLLLGAFFMAAGFLLTPWSLRAMGTTEEALPGAILYQRIYFLGMIPNVVYNMGTGVLRAVGDARRPLYFLIAASLCNIVLDLVLVVGFGLAVLGVALATVLSQLLSAVLVVLSLMRSQGQAYQLFPRQLRLYGAPLKDAMRVGVPAALQSVMYSASNIVIQAAINSFGTDAVAAWTAYGKMDVIFWMSINAMALAITTFAGQNYGAGQYDRLKKGVRVSVGMSAGFTVLLSTAMTVFARPILSIFSPDPDVLEIGVAMVRFLAPCYITYILVELLPGAIRGAGRSMVPMLISVFGVCVLRLVWLFTVVPAHHTIEAVELSYPITWAVTSAAVLIYYRWGHWLQPRNGTE
ncbi:MATE family efflux transporter [Flavonifractor sp. DFI.6.63]|uniref:MATE family efflux transporter n=1 Tax=Lawsonibacter hominis TaxID=2763053 RepID=A0A8J6JFZ6_9FIRM|nr:MULTISPECIES: MATE family efflux transporter [Oscillospiraceae]MBS1383436.1 MATE family efflux transporter [Flavonifractor sp.]MDU2195597.1 MATE family efflux transporter [Clostridiales bacterium]MDY2977372.1 MATE family efflux transporter [Oscillospiraceae bacterium]MBC5734562.1 MATE family efflux transporter [Lawsonibacter hominis]MCQ5028038.1 MATE family efflux transporter [Flavonifractor sp. DFI.6.63]